MDKPIRGISLYDFEKIQLKAKMIAGLSDIFIIVYDYIFENDVFRCALECLSEETSRLSEECDRLMKDAEK